MIYMSSDLHLSHTNILKYCQRPFQNTREMDEKLISNHNEIVGQDDEIYYTGDLGFNPKYVAKCLSRMNGKKYLIKGNHDKVKPILLEQLEWVKDYHELTVQKDKMDGGRKQLIILCHYKFCVWNASHFGSWNLFGHSHSTIPDDPNSLSMDVGVDAVAYRFSKDKNQLDPNQYRPISYEEVKKIMNRKLKLMTS